MHFSSPLISPALLLLLLLPSLTSALPNALPAPPSSSPAGLKPCRCPGWDQDGPCYLTPWSGQLARAGWGGTPGDFFCATYSQTSAAAAAPDMSRWYSCPKARDNGDPKNCESCAQSGAPGSTSLCRGHATCFQNSHNYWTGSDHVAVFDCTTFTAGKREGEEGKWCPMIGEEDAECGRQWWKCGEGPSPEAKCWKKGDGGMKGDEELWDAVN